MKEYLFGFIFGIIFIVFVLWLFGIDERLSAIEEYIYSLDEMSYIYFDKININKLY